MTDIEYGRKIQACNAMLGFLEKLPADTEDQRGAHMQIWMFIHVMRNEAIDGLNGKGEEV